MFSNAQNQPQGATIINIHSPEDEMQPVTESSFGRRPSNTSRPTSQPSAQSHAKPKPSPKVEEYRKMIQHITNKIIKRKRPPTALSHLNDFSRTTQVNDTFENDDTIDLLIQLRSALMVCHQIGLSSQVLFQGERTPTNSPLSSRSNSPLPSPRIESPIRSPEPFGSAVPLFSIANNQSSKSHTEFDIILYILSDLVLNDSRYKTSNPKPSRPPFTMQAILIDLATILTQIRDDSSGLYLIGTVFMPAFESFSEGTMLGRLLAFFIDSLLPKLMKCKDEPKSRLNNKTTNNESSTKAVQTKTVHPNTPTINIQSAEPDQLSVPTKASHLTIDTRPLTVAAQSSSPISPAALSVNSNYQAQSLSAYHAFSLFTPLLFFMIQYLDPYLAAQPSRAQQDNLTYTLTRQANSIHNFHKALSYMMSCKPDLYLDLLDIISHSTSEVKFRACQVLFNYYIVSVGHVVVADPLPRLGTQEELEILDQRRLQQELEEEHQRNHQQPNSHSTTQNRTTKDPTRAELVEDDWAEEQHVWYSYMFDEDDSNTKILSNNPFSFGAYKSPTDSHCKECFKPIQGCGLHCFQCRSNIHIDCYNSKAQMDDHGMLFYMKAGGIQKVVAPQRCIVPPQPRCRDMVDRGLLQWNIKSSAPKVGLLGHLFQLVNLFTATLCICCHLPLWGTCLQAYQCTTCFRFIHPECLAEIEESNNLSSVHSHNPLSPSTSAHRLQKCSSKSSLQESDITISQADLEKSLAAFYDDALSTQSEFLEGKSFEEVGLMVNTLLIQENILHCGVASGCMIITQESDDPLLLTTDTLHNQGRPSSHSALLSQAINAYSDFLESAENVHVSTFFVDFFDHSDFTAVKHLMNKQDFLYHLGAMMKSLVTSSDDGISNFSMNNRQHKRASDNSQGFLQVSPSPFAANTWEDDEYNNELNESHTPNENLDRSVLLSWIMTNLNFKSLRAAEILLQHMRNIGIFERFDASPLLFVRHVTAEKVENEPAVQCIFPVPCAIDFSASVESLVNSIEACVQDIDLSINECGLLLLTRRCWPDRFMSHYTQERLIRAIIGWTFDEDERLLALHAEITSLNRHSSLHHSKQQNKWVQAALLARMKVPASAERSRQSTFHVNTTAPSVNSGASNIYVTTRAGLKDRYVVRWMSAIQGMNPETYTDMIFNAIEEIIDSKREECILPDWEELSEVKNHTLQKYELFINYITKLKNNGLTFNSLDSILEKWFESTYTEFQILGMLQDKEPSELRNLVKLCSTKSTHGRIPSNMSSSSVNPIDLVVSQFQNKDEHVIDRGMRWLTLMTYSGVDLTSNALSRISKLLIELKVALKTIVEFVKIIWFQVIHINAFAARRAVIADIVGYLSESTSETLELFNNDRDLPDESLIDVQSFVKYCAALVCFAYGCSTEEIIKATLVPFTGDHTIKAGKKSVTVDHDLIEVDENTPSIDNMLSFLKYDQLNLREYVVKMFYCITQWGHGISNKEELINACISKLIPVVWELLSPAHDHISSINLNLLMHLINVDVRYFEACVFKIFEDANWEVRYQGLDNLFGLFTKMDAAFQTEWLKLLSKLGPVFSYFVGCLWDKEEYVRLKAFALIRSFGTLHLQSAFRCWEAYFLTATDRQKMSLVSLMTQLNALFPEWQVLQWESLLEALESKLAINALDDYSHVSTGRDFLTKESRAPEQLSAESENVQALMLTLALQMLSSHLNIEPSQLYRLKFILVQQMNFEDCHYINEGGEIAVSFGALRYDPDNSSQVAVMLTCTRGLKKIMDSFAPLPAEAVANIASDSFEQNRINLAENSSPGVYFIDVVLKAVNSGIELTKMGHMMLKTWLEIILIIVYKHNILEREYEQSIVTCMKHIIEILTEQISDENKLLILEILKCLLKRSDHLTAMVLSKQILALGKLMTKLGTRHSEPVYLKAKQFLKSAFLRFAVAGLFVLMFKNQAASDISQGDVDLFFVLRTVIDPDDIIPDEEFQGETIYLRDQPVRDVLDKLMKQQMERKAFSTVLFNTSKYVEAVHSSPYAESILNDYAGFLQALVKHTSDWRRSDWNINPVFTMSAILLKEHPYHHVILVPSIQAVLKHGLSNCTIQADAVVKLMIAYTITVPGAKPSNNAFARILVEEVKNALSVLTRPSKDTLLVLLQIVLYDIKPAGQEWYNTIEASFLGKSQGATNYSHKSYFESKLFDLLPYFVNYLKRTTTSQQFTRKDFKIYSCIAQLVVLMASKDPKLTVIIFGYLKLEEGVHCLRFLNWFILTLLKEKADILLPEIIRYENVLTELLVRTLNTVEIDFHAPDLNFSYSSANEKVLLSFLLIKSCSLMKMRYILTTTDKVNSPDSPMFWMAIWPAIRRLLDSIESSTLFTVGNVGVSIWNTFLSLLQFLFATRNAIVTVNAYEWNELLSTLMKKIKSENNTFQGNDIGIEQLITLDEFQKQIEKIKIMFDVPPVEVPLPVIVDQMLIELRDAMRLQAESIAFQGSSRDLMHTLGSTF